MEQTKGLSCQIPESLHARVTAERVAANQSLSRVHHGSYLPTTMKMEEKKTWHRTRTMAFQISEDLFQRIKDYLAHENERQGRKVTQKEFVIGLIEDALERWEQETADADPGAPTDTLDPIDEPADSAPSWEAEETEGGAKNVAE